VYPPNIIARGRSTLYTSPMPTPLALCAAILVAAVAGGGGAGVAQATPHRAPGIPGVHRAEAIDFSDDMNTVVGIEANNIGLATGLGAMAGGVTGVVVGCPLGAVTTGLTALPTGPVAAPAAVLGCLTGASVVGGVGAIVGGALIGGPVAVASAFQAYNILHADRDISAPIIPPHPEDAGSCRTKLRPK